MGRILIAKLKTNPKLPVELLLKRLLGTTIGPTKVQSLIVPPTLTHEMFLVIVTKSDPINVVGKSYTIGQDNHLQIIALKTVVEARAGWREIK